MKEVAAAVAGLDERSIKALLEAGTVEVAGETLHADEVIVTRTPRPGTLVETSGPLAVSLDTELDEELATEGAAREIVSRIQTMRRDAGLAMTDRIVVAWWSEDPQVAAAFSAHGEFIAGEVLADRAQRDENVEPGGTDDELVVGLRIERV